MKENYWKFCEFTKINGWNKNLHQKKIKVLMFVIKLLQNIKSVGKSNLIQFIRYNPLVFDNVSACASV